MAIKPNDGETFLREVDEELRKEQMNQFVARYGWALIAGFVLLLGAIGGWIWWQDQQAAEAAKQGETLLEALDGMESGARSGRGAQDRRSSPQSDIDGYRAAALFARANPRSPPTTRPRRSPPCAASPAMRTSPSPIARPRWSARPRSSSTRCRRSRWSSGCGRWRGPGQPLFGTAGEMVGIAHLKMRRPDLAGPLFAAIGRDESVPPSIRTRTIQMAGSLGFNAMEPEPSGPAAAGRRRASRPRRRPPAAREKAE